MDNINIGNRIRRLRSINNLTIKELALKLNSSSGYLSDLEHNKSIPSLSKLQDICNCFEISISDFLKTDDTDLNIIPNHFKKFYEDNSHLTEQQLDSVSNMIKELIPNRKEGY